MSLETVLFESLIRKPITFASFIDTLLSFTLDEFFGLLWRVEYASNFANSVTTFEITSSRAKTGNLFGYSRELRDRPSLPTAGAQWAGYGGIRNPSLSA
jgi:hypothetical protein